MDVLIRRAEGGDVNEIAELEAVCFKGEDPWSAGAFFNEIVENRDKTLYLVAVADGRIVGYMGLWRILDEGHITNVAVDPTYRRNHIGEALIKEMVRLTEEGGTESWTLEVRVDNEAAIRLYEKMGFISYGVRPRYYEYDGTDALIMWKGKEL